MVFNSPIFLFFFLPAALFLIVVAGAKRGNIALLALSLFFYVWSEPSNCWILLVSILINYAVGRLIGKDLAAGGSGVKALAAGIVFNLGLLIFFKYANFILSNANQLAMLAQGAPLLRAAPIALPIGISFFTFQALSYLIDVQRRQIPPQQNLFKFSLYLSMFPVVFAGPIVRYPQVAAAIDSRGYDADNWASGARRFILGMGKKLLLANTLSAFCDQVIILPGNEISMGLAWLGAIAYTLQIYFDFSGYTDMALGLGRILGFRYPENFDYPYFSQGIQEFWRRWHMSLSSWFRDYLYIPLGGNRHGALTTYRNLFIVFTLCGLWHGASWNFLVWGFFHGFFIVIERVFLLKVLSRVWRPMRHAYAITVITVGWIFFRLEHFSQALDYLKAMFGFGASKAAAHSVAMYLNPETLIVLVLGSLGALPILPGIAARLGLNAEADTPPFPRTVLCNGLALAILLLSLVYAASSTYNPFIYFQF